MPRIPQLDDQGVREQGGGQGFVRTQPGQIARIAGNIQRGLSGAAQVLSNIQLRETERANNSNVMKALGQAGEAINGLTFGEQGFTRIEGEDATREDLAGTFMKAADDSFEAIRGTLHNDRQREDFDARIEAKRVSFNHGLQQHVARQTDAVNAQRLQSTQSSSRETVIGLRHNEALMADEITSTVELIEKHGDGEGWPKEQVDDEVNQWRSGSIGAAIDRLVQDDRVESARELFDDLMKGPEGEDGKRPGVPQTDAQGRRLLLPSHAGKIEQYLGPEEDKAWGVRHAQEDFAKQVEGEVVTADNLRFFKTQRDKITDPGRRAAYDSEIELQKADSAEIVGIEQDELFQAGRAFIQGGGRFRALSNEIKLGVRPSQRNSLISMDGQIHSQQDRATQWDVIYPVLNEMTDEQFADSKFDIEGEWGHLLSNADLKEMIFKQRRLRADLEKPDGPPKHTFTDTQLIKSAIIENGLTDDEEKGVFTLEAQRALMNADDASIAKTGQPIDQPARRQILEDQGKGYWLDTLGWRNRVIPKGLVKLFPPDKIMGTEGPVPTLFQAAIVDALDAREGPRRETVDPDSGRVRSLFAHYDLGNIGSDDQDIVDAINKARARSDAAATQEEVGEFATVVRQRTDTPVPADGGEEVLLRQTRTPDGTLVNVPIDPERVAVARAWLSKRSAGRLTHEAVRDLALKVWAFDIIQERGSTLIPRDPLDALGIHAASPGPTSTDLTFYALTGEEIGLSTTEANRILNLTPQDTRVDQVLSGDASALTRGPVVVRPPKIRNLTSTQ